MSHNVKRIVGIVAILAIILGFSPVHGQDQDSAELKLAGVQNVSKANEYVSIKVIRPGDLDGWMINDNALAGFAEADFRVYTQALPAGSVGNLALNQTTPLFNAGNQIVLKKDEIIVDTLKVPKAVVNAQQACEVLGPDGNKVKVPLGFYDPKSNLTCKDEGWRYVVNGNQVTPKAPVSTEETTSTPSAVATQSAVVTTVPTTAVPTQADNVTAVTPMEVLRIKDALAYPALIQADPKREPNFPDVKKGARRPLVGYDKSFENGDYFQTGKGDIDVPQYYFRVMTAGKIKIAELGIDCVATEKVGCLAIIINHFGPTSMWRNAEVDNGFTVAGRVWDMSKPAMVTEAAQALIDHYVYRMTGVADGANCGVIDACGGVKYDIVVVGNGTLQVHWTGVFMK